MEELNKVRRVQKRDGQLVLFDDKKITDCIFKAVKAVGQDDYPKAKNLSAKVVSILDIFFKGGVIPTVEMMQDLIEKTLIESAEVEIAKAYILYRDQRRRIRDEDAAMMDVQKTMDGYLRQSDWRVAENANMNYSLSGLLMHAATSVFAHYTLNTVYPPEIAEAHRSADLHIHDLGMGIAGYCAGWSLRQLLTEGFNGVPGKIDSKPPKHFDSALWQMINFIGTMQNEWAGAQAFSSFDTYLAPLVKYDGLPYKKVKQAIQGFVFNMNVPSRWGGQTPFTNLTIDWVVPDDMKDRKAIVGGKEHDFTYGECQTEMDMINRAFMEVITEGDAKGRVFTFPIPTYNVTEDFDWDGENATILFDMTSKYGIPYFQNFINSELKPGDVRSMCCRLQMDMRELRQKGGGLFGAVEMTGSIGVVTINMPRIGYLAKTKEEFFERITKLMDLAKNSLELKRKMVQRNMDNGLMPFTKRYLGTLQNHFNTIGLNGMNEALMNFFGADTTIATPKGIKFTEEVLDFMRDRLTKYQEETGHIYNLEATPAEGTAYRFAKMDRERYPDIITAGRDEPYYTNSTQLPVNYTTDIFEALELQDSLQIRYTGGTVLHGFLGEMVSDAETCKKLVKRIAYNFRLPYFTITPTFSVCPKHGYIPGRHETCPYEDEGEEKTSQEIGVRDRV
jgi:ribonucleoside-triphosphate reductase (formate)